MKINIIKEYRCEYCGFTSRDEKETFKHEAEHFNLTSKEYKQYFVLKEELKKACWKASYCFNDITRKKEDEAAQALVDFEKLHRMKIP